MPDRKFNKWLISGLGPFLPLIPLHIEAVYVFTSRFKCLSFCKCDLIKLVKTDPTFNRWSLRGIPFDTLWKPILLPEISKKLKNCVNGPKVLIFLPEALKEVPINLQISTLKEIWSVFESGDILIVASSNPAYRWKSLFSYLLFLCCTRNSNAYICLGRKPNETLKLISTKYTPQLTFISSAGKKMGVIKKYIHFIISFLGVYPWIESEHIFIAKK